MTKKLPESPGSELEPNLEKPEEFLEELNKRVSNVVGREKASIVVGQIVSLYREEQFSGPIAHPKHLRDYNDIVPGSAERIIKLAESSHDHHKEMDMQIIAAEIEDLRAGRRYGFAALIALFAGAVLFGLLGNNILAGAFLGSAALGTIGVLVKGSRANAG